jgi:hypothetical protein
MHPYYATSRLAQIALERMARDEDYIPNGEDLRHIGFVKGYDSNAYAEAKARVTRRDQEKGS